MNVKVDDERILVVENSGEVAFYFSPKDFEPSEEEVQKTAWGLIYNGDCIGVGASRLLKGEIRMFFNPMVQKEHNYERVIEKISAAIMKPNFAAVLGD